MIAHRPSLDTLVRVENASFSRHGLLRLDKNEDVAGPPRWLLREAFARLSPAAVASYPEVFPLYAALSAWLDLPQDRLYVSAGSDAAIKAVFEAFARPGEPVAVLSPSYAMYRVYAALFEAPLLEIGYDADLEPDLDALRRAAGGAARIIFLANPNSPTGTLIDLETLRGLINLARKNNVLVLVDEAYHGFCPHTALPWVEAFDNLVVTRTFSKYFGLASARLGFAAACPGLAALLRKVRPMYEVNAYAVALGLTALEHPELLERRAKGFAAGKKCLLAGLARLGLACRPFHGNFALIEVGGAARAEAVRQALLERGILVGAGLGHPAMAGCIRVTVGNASCMKRFLKALGEIVSPAPRPARKAAPGGARGR